MARRKKESAAPGSNCVHDAVRACVALVVWTMGVNALTLWMAASRVRPSSPSSAQFSASTFAVCVAMSVKMVSVLVDDVVPTGMRE